MQLIKVGAAVLNQTPLAWDANKANILEAIRLAREEGVSLLCLPELCITGYGCEDAFLSPGVQKTAQDVLLEIAPQTSGMIVALGLPTEFRGALYNTACLLVDGKVVALVAKQHLAGSGIHYEPRWFKPWPATVRESIELDDQRVPMGDTLIDCGGVLLGFEICEDAWVANRTGSALARRGADVLLNPSASHFAFDKQNVRRRFVLEGSRAFNVTYLFSNHLGNEAGRAVYDGGAMIASNGELLAQGPRFSFQDVGLTSATVDIEATRMSRSRMASYDPQWSQTAQRPVQAEFSYPDLKPERREADTSDWEQGDFVKEEEFARAVSLSLYDYLRKSRSRGFVVSLSGGADSSAVASLCGLAVRLGTTELGPERFLSKLTYIPELAGLRDPAEIVRRLVTCVYQSTRNSSQTTRAAPRRVSSAPRPVSRRRWLSKNPL